MPVLIGVLFGRDDGMPVLAVLGFVVVGTIGVRPVLGASTGCSFHCFGVVALVGSGSTIGGDIAVVTVFFTPSMSGILTLLVASLSGLGLGSSNSNGTPTATAAAAAQGITDSKETEERERLEVRVRLKTWLVCDLVDPVAILGKFGSLEREAVVASISINCSLL